MAPELDDSQEARRQVKALKGVLRRSGWYGRGSLQDAQYRWAATGLSVEAIEAYLAAGIADPRVAAEFASSWASAPSRSSWRESASRSASAPCRWRTRQRPSMAPAPPAGLTGTGYRAALRQEAAWDLGSVLKEGSRWWHSRIQRLAGFLDDQPVPSEQVGWLSQQSDHLLSAGATPRPHGPGH
jgi:hypothetical protein